MFVSFDESDNGETQYCPMCFEPIYEMTNKCPNCGFILTQQMEKKQREINENLKLQKIEEIQNEYNASGIINRLNLLLNGGGNTFYYTKLLPLKPEKLDIEMFNSEVLRLTNYCKKKGYKPYYIVYKLRDKIAGVK